jgi:hypothetical protein
METTRDHVFYVTIGTPRDDGADRWDEDGVTIARMEAAVDWISRLKTLDSFDIAQGLMARFPTYQLGTNPAVPPKFQHPLYFGNTEGGAWGLFQYSQEGAQCQAIARLVRGMMRQVGVPDEVAVVKIWGDPVPKQELVAKPGRYFACMDVHESEWLTGSKDGLDSRREVGGEMLTAWWVDGPMYVDEQYPDENGEMPGLNRYEACLKVTRQSNPTEVRYFPGGAQMEKKMVRREEILDSFWGLVWLAKGSGTGDGGSSYVVRSVHWIRRTSDPKMPKKKDEWSCTNRDRWPCSRRGGCTYFSLFDVAKNEDVK